MFQSSSMTYAFSPPIQQNTSTSNSAGANKNKKKVEELNFKFRKMYWLLGRHSRLATDSKILLYKQALGPVSTYGVQLWGCTKKNHTEKNSRTKYCAALSTCQ